jgi:hypothetical protein
MTSSRKGKSSCIVDEEKWKEEGIVTFQSASELFMRNDDDSSFHDFDKAGVE